MEKFIEVRKVYFVNVEIVPVMTAFAVFTSINLKAAIECPAYVLS